MKESDIMRAIQLAMGYGDVRMFRNNVGMLFDARGQAVRYGLGTGTSDLVGWQSLVITPEHIGQRIAQFMAIEVKRLGQHATKEQAAFIEQVRKAGGAAGIARSVADAEQILRGA